MQHSKTFIVFTLLFAVAVPLSLQASLFSVLFDTVSAESPETIVYENMDTAQGVPLLRAILNSDPNPARGGGDILIADGALVPSGATEKKDVSVNAHTANGEIGVYIVREGDTLSQIAHMYDVSAKTILWANDIANASTIHPGDTLVILPITGVRHVVKKGDTLKTIAKKYNGDVDDIIAYNQFSKDVELSIGDTVIIPDGTIATPKQATPKSGGALASGGGSSGFINPLPGAVKTQGIHGYNGIDLSGVSVGASVVAAAGGEVIVAKSSGWNGGYGSYVVIKHPNGTQTLYAHLSSVSVSVGQSVKAGSVVGGMGNTGRSTGPHLHFEVRGARNPF